MIAAVPAPLVVTDPADPRVADFRNLKAGDRPAGTPRVNRKPITSESTHLSASNAGTSSGRFSAATRPGTPKTARTR